MSGLTFRFPDVRQGGQNFSSLLTAVNFQLRSASVGWSRWRLYITAEGRPTAQTSCGSPLAKRETDPKHGKPRVGKVDRGQLCQRVTHDAVPCPCQRGRAMGLDVQCARPSKSLGLPKIENLWAKVSFNKQSLSRLQIAEFETGLTDPFGAAACRSGAERRHGHAVDARSGVARRSQSPPSPTRKFGDALWRFTLSAASRQRRTSGNQRSARPGKVPFDLANEWFGVLREGLSLEIVSPFNSSGGENFRRALQDILSQRQTALNRQELIDRRKKPSWRYPWILKV